MTEWGREGGGGRTVRSRSLPGGQDAGLVLVPNPGGGSGAEDGILHAQLFDNRVRDGDLAVAARVQHDPDDAAPAALEAAGCTPDMSFEDICEALVAVMPTITVDGITGQGMTWAASGEVSKAPMAVVIRDGVYVTP